jgi:hypothetical protein
LIIDICLLEDVDEDEVRHLPEIWSCFTLKATRRQLVVPAVKQSLYQCIWGAHREEKLAKYAGALSFILGYF